MTVPLLPLLVLVTFHPALGANRKCGEVPEIWQQVFDSEDFSSFSELVQSVYPCPPPLDEGTTIFPVPNSVVDALPRNDPLFTNPEYRKTLIGLHIVPDHKVTAQNLIHKTHSTQTPCANLRGFTKDTSGTPTVGLFGLGNSFEFTASPTVLNAAQMIAPNAMVTEYGIVHPVDSFLEPEQTMQAPSATPADGMSWEQYAAISNDPTTNHMLYCPTTRNFVEACTCCPDAPFPAPTGGSCSTRQVGLEFVFSSTATVTGKHNEKFSVKALDELFSGNAKCDPSSANEDINALERAFENAFDLDRGSAEVNILSCFLRDENDPVTLAHKRNSKGRILADPEWFIGALHSQKGRSSKTFRSKVTAALNDPNHAWRQKLVDAFDILGYSYLTELLRDLGLLGESVCLPIGLVSSCGECSAPPENALTTTGGGVCTCLTCEKDSDCCPEKNFCASVGKCGKGERGTWSNGGAHDAYVTEANTGWDRLGETRLVSQATIPQTGTTGAFYIKGFGAYWIVVRTWDQWIPTDALGKTLTLTVRMMSATFEVTTDQCNAAAMLELTTVDGSLLSPFLTPTHDHTAPKDVWVSYKVEHTVTADLLGVPVTVKVFGICPTGAVMVDSWQLDLA